MQDVQGVKSDQLRDTLKTSQKAKKESRRETVKRKKAEVAAINAHLKVFTLVLLSL